MQNKVQCLHMWVWQVLTLLHFLQHSSPINSCKRSTPQAPNVLIHPFSSNTSAFSQLQPPENTGEEYITIKGEDDLPNSNDGNLVMKEKQDNLIVNFKCLTLMI